MKDLWRKFVGLVTSNKGLKILSLIIAAICWYGIQGIHDSPRNSEELSNPSGEVSECSKTIRLPVKIMLLPPEKNFKVALEPDEVRLEVVESEGKNAANQISSVSVFVDVSNIQQSGDYRLPVQSVSTPMCHVVDISPAHVKLKAGFNDEVK